MRRIRSGCGRALYSRAVPESLREIVEAIHESNVRVVLAVTGGGSRAISELLSVPGASRTLLEAVVPYSSDALAQFLRTEPEQACSAETASELARRALARARALARGSGSLVGLGLTASLVSDRPKRGAHRAHLAAATERGLGLWSIELDKGARDRDGEEALVAAAAILALASTCAVDAPGLRTVLGAGDRLTEHPLLVSGDLIRDLLAGRVERVTLLRDGSYVADGPVPEAVLSGSFNPLHNGHLELARVAGVLLGTPVGFELSVINADKAALSHGEVQRRLTQFAGRAAVELTRRARFDEKAELLPGTTFVVGSDTAERIVDPKYYGGSEEELLRALDRIAESGCRFLVAGRADESGEFRTIASLGVPEAFGELFAAIPESQFRVDLASTSLRQSSESR